MLWIAILALSAITTVALTVATIYFEKRAGLLCVDVHKVEKPKIPCNGGIALFASLSISMLLLYISGFIKENVFAAVEASLLISFFIGLADDIYDLKSRWKIALGFLPALPLIVLHCYVPRPWIPFVGYVRISTLYPLLLLLAFTVYQNAANMIDTHNGTLPFAVFSAHLVATAILISHGVRVEDSMVLFTFVTVIFFYMLFNIYPAKIFNGNTGAFVLGATIPLALALNRLELYYILASTPMYINGFYYIASVKGFLQKQSVKRPTYVDEEGCIHPSDDPSAPITLVRLVLKLSGSPMSEKELVEALYTIFFASAAIAAAIVTALGFKPVTPIH